MTKNYTENLFVGLCASDKNGGPTQMALQLADSLERKGGFDIDDIGKRYLNWHKRDGYDAGPTANRVFQLVSKGISFTKASEQVDYELAGRTAGCNPAHRATPLAMLDVSDKELIDISIQEAKLTHWHPLAADVSVATVLLCRKLWQGEDWHAAVANTRKGRLIETQRALEAHKMDELNGNGYAPNVLAAAMFFLSNSKSITEAIERSIDFAGPANYCPVLVGTIGAAKWSNN
jgi:ADP-ribosylglycohydrolase